MLRFQRKSRTRVLTNACDLFFFAVCALLFFCQAFLFHAHFLSQLVQHFLQRLVMCALATCLSLRAVLAGGESPFAVRSADSRVIIARKRSRESETSGNSASRPCERHTEKSFRESERVRCVQRNSHSTWRRRERRAESGERRARERRVNDRQAAEQDTRS